MYHTVNIKRIENALSVAPTLSAIASVISKAERLERLTLEEVALLLNGGSELFDELLFSKARQVKATIYGKRLVLFAPLYVSSICANDCTYCGFRSSNKEVARRRLTPEEISRETTALLATGQRRVLLVSGESCTEKEFTYICDAIRAVYSVHDGAGGIRRLNVNIAPLTTDQFRRLKEHNIGTYQIFQESYHPQTYAKHHLRGPKKDYGYRLDTIDRAFAAGIDDVGVGVLLGLYDYRWELLALMDHIEHLEERFGMGPHTISIPRLEPAQGSDVSSAPPHPVSDTDLLRIIAVLRLAVPYTGIILSTRESPQLRRRAFDLGVSQVSAGSCTSPGGYSDSEALAQFSLGDHRSLDEVVRDIIESGHIPSFCTSCYRLGRTGHDFMDLAKPGEIAQKCGPNALLTLREYLDDFASEETRRAGYALLERELSECAGSNPVLDRLIKRVMNGERDLYV